MKNALPPGTNHHAQVKRVTAAVEGAANAAIENHVGPRPVGSKRVKNAVLPAKTIKAK